MYTHEKAELFARNLFEDVISNGKFELLTEYYSQDMIEHYDNLKYNLDDIKNRLINNATQDDQKYSLEVEMVDTSKDFIFCLCRKISLDDSYDRSIKEFEFWVCQLKDNKICEAWCMVDKVVQSDLLKPIFSADCGNTTCDFPTAML